jgi:head-tail adaptor
MISGGLLRWVATVQTPSSTLDSLGMRTATWTDGATFRCDLRENSANEQGYADGVAVIRSIEVRARWQAVQGAGLTEVCRLVVRGRTLKVNAIRNLDEADRVAVIDCTEVN